MKQKYETPIVVSMEELDKSIGKKDKPKKPNPGRGHNYS